MRALLMPAVVAAVQITSPSHHDADQMRESFYGLAAAKDKNGGKLDNTTKIEVDRILDLVKSNLIEALWVDRDEAQRGYNASVALVNGCNSQLTTTHLPALRDEEDITTEEYDCLKMCLDEENVICGHKEGNCTALDQYVCGWAPEVCDDGPLDDDECSECKEEDPTGTKLYNAAKCLVAFETKHYTKYIEMNQKCDDLKSDLRNKEGECTNKQKDFEQQKCFEQEKARGYCDTHDTCWTSTTGSYDQTKSSTQSLEAIFQKQWTALQCLLCYGEQILADKTDLTVCENAARPTFECCDNEERRTSPSVSLAICYYAHEDKYDCEDEKDPVVPCTDSWNPKYYGSYDNTCAKVDGCLSPCSAF